MKRTLGKNGMLTCWCCGSSNVNAKKDFFGKTNKFYCQCEDCGEKTVNTVSEKTAIGVWNKAYANNVD